MQRATLHTPLGEFVLGRFGAKSISLRRGPSLWECSTNIVLEVEIGLSETVPQTPRPIYFLKELVETFHLSYWALPKAPVMAVQVL